MCYLHTPSPRLELLVTPPFYKTKNIRRYTALLLCAPWSCTFFSDNVRWTLSSDIANAKLMRLLISPLKSIIDTFFNGQLVTPIVVLATPCLSCILLCFSPHCAENCSQLRRFIKQRNRYACSERWRISHCEPFCEIAACYSQWQRKKAWQSLLFNQTT